MQWAWLTWCRYIMTISINDAFSQVWLSCFDNVGKLIMGMSADELEALRVWFTWYDYLLVHTDLVLRHRMRRRLANILLLLLKPLARHIYSGAKQRWIVMGKPRGWNTRLWVLYRLTGPKNVQDWYVDHWLFGGKFYSLIWEPGWDNQIVFSGLGLGGFHCISLSVRFLLFRLFESL